MSLLGLIRREKGLRRIFGKRELEIIERQILGIKLRPSERIRLSRDIRKKFEVIGMLAPYAEEFKLKKGSEVKRLVNEIKEDILESEYFPRIKRIYLFGSAVENELTFRSDIDIAVEFDKIDIKEATEFRIHFSANDKLDIQVYNVLPEKITKEIDLKGRVIYERK
jgi:predicted nucleotidyltransferase